MRMLPTILPSLSRPLCRIFPHYLINGKIFEKFVVNFCTNLSETFLTVRRIHRDMITNVHRSSCKVTAILLDLMKLELFRQTFKK